MKRTTVDPVVGRQCRLMKRKDFDGYGFLLQSKKDAIGHFIIAVEDSSPADRVGVRVGDRVISINGRCVRDRSHKQVVELINEFSGQVDLLLVDAANNDVFLDDVKVDEDSSSSTSSSGTTKDIPQRGKQLSDDTDQPGRSQVINLGTDEPVVGLTTLDDKLYVLIGYHDVHLLVFDTSLEHREYRRLAVGGVGRPIDLTLCSRHRCLYVSDCDNNCVHRVMVIDVMMTPSTDDANQLKTINWPVGEAPCGLSVAPSTWHVLVTCTNSRLIKQFTAEGQLLHEINVGLARPFHAIRLVTGQLVVCHGGTSDSTHGVSIVEEKTGKLVRTYGGGVKGAQVNQLNSPWHVAVDDRSTGIRSVYVADFNNGRVVQLRLTSVPEMLTHVRDVLTRDRHAGWIWMPFRLHMDTCRRILYVAENKLSLNYEFAKSQIAIVRL